MPDYYQTIMVMLFAAPGVLSAVSAIRGVSNTSFFIFHQGRHTAVHAA
jgi:hypothetical protein